MLVRLLHAIIIKICTSCFLLAPLGPPLNSEVLLDLLVDTSPPGERYSRKVSTIPRSRVGGRLLTKRLYHTPAPPPREGYSQTVSSIPPLPRQGKATHKMSLPYPCSPARGRLLTKRLPYPRSRARGRLPTKRLYHNPAPPPGEG